MENTKDLRRLHQHPASAWAPYGVALAAFLVSFLLRQALEQAARFVVRDANGQQLGYFYFEEEPGRRSAAKLLTKDEVRRIAANWQSCPSYFERHDILQAFSDSTGGRGDQEGQIEKSEEANQEGEEDDEKSKEGDEESKEKGERVKYQGR